MLSIMLFDELLERHIGPLGKYQILVFVLVGMEEVFIGLNTMSPVFTAAVPSTYHCRHPQLNNDTIFGNCSVQQMLRLTVPPGQDSDDTNPNGLSRCHVYTTHFLPGACVGEDPVVNAVSEAPGADKSGPPAENAASERQTERDDVTLSGNGTSAGEVALCGGSWLFDQSEFTSTIAMEWDLVCTSQRKFKAKSVGSVFLAGRAVGNFIFGWIADRYGRRKVFLGSGVSAVIVSLVCAFLPTYTSYVIMRFFLAVLATAKTNTGFIIAMEYAGRSRRVVVGSVYFVFWSVSIILLAIIAYFIRDWRTLLIVISVPEILIYIVAFFRLRESPRWLLVKNRYQEAHKVIQEMARVNKAELPAQLVVQGETEKSSVSPIDLVRTPQIRLASLVLFFCWATYGLLYYAINFGVGDLAGNIYWNNIISGVIEIPATLLIIVLFKYGGRVKTMAGCTILSGISLLCGIIVQSHGNIEWASLLVYLAGKFFIVIAFNMIWIYCGECYPTCVRSLGVTVTAIGARMVGPVTPYVFLLSSVAVFAPNLLMGSLAVVTGLLILLLPETKGQNMCQTIEEGEKFIRNNKLPLFGCGKQKKGKAAIQPPTTKDDIVKAADTAI